MLESKIHIFFPRQPIPTESPMLGRVWRLGRWSEPRFHLTRFHLLGDAIGEGWCRAVGGKERPQAMASALARFNGCTTVSATPPLRGKGGAYYLLPKSASFYGRRFSAFSPLTMASSPPSSSQVFYLVILKPALFFFGAMFCFFLYMLLLAASFC